jgi:renal tumor antigen
MKCFSKLLIVLTLRSDEPTGRLALVFELMDMNMYDAIKGRRHYLPENRVKYYIYQLLKSIDHMHRNGIFHRDIKPENILLMEDQVKLADFGSCRGIYSNSPILNTSAHGGIERQNACSQMDIMDTKWICGELDVSFLK